MPSNASHAIEHFCSVTLVILQNKIVVLRVFFSYSETCNYNIKLLDLQNKFVTAIVLLPLLLTFSSIRISKITHYISMRTVIMHPNFFFWLWRLCKMKLIECRFEKLTFPTCMNRLAFIMIVLIACNKWYIRQLLFYVWLYMCRLF